MADVEKCGDQLGLHRSGKHLQVFGEALTGSRIFTQLVARLLSVFELTLVDCWVNLYRHGGDMKSWHHDNYYDRTPRPSATLGVSLGETRDLCFLDVATGCEYRVPQSNGDVFAFDAPFNRHFKHAVLPAPGRGLSTRLAVILWVNEDIVVPRVIRTRNPGMRSEVALEVSWEGWAVSATRASAATAEQAAEGHEQAAGGRSPDSAVATAVPSPDSSGRANRVWVPRGGCRQADASSCASYATSYYGTLEEVHRSGRNAAGAAGTRLAGDGVLAAPESPMATERSEDGVYGALQSHYPRRWGSGHWLQVG